MVIQFREESYRIMGACFEVYKEKGPGFLEAVYQECLAIELGLRDIPFEREFPLALEYKGHELESTYKADFLCFGQIILELKAVPKLCDEHRAQLHNYLKATKTKLGILLNFGAPKQLAYERIVY